ncbi:hypothetical protein AGMMS4956_06230 [Bacteroidia bacterium]|nr:hypothetical protein AGMMS4956_06230 [Bacteroidia bacterium]
MWGLGGTPLLEKTVTLHLQNQALEAALSEITKQTDIRFSYSPQAIDAHRTISIEVKNVPVKKALEQLLGNGYEYKMSGTMIILRKNQTKNEPIAETRNPAQDAALKPILAPITPITVKKICISNSGVITLDCLNDINPNFFNKTKIEMQMKKQLAAIILASAMTAGAAQAQDSAASGDPQHTPGADSIVTADASLPATSGDSVRPIIFTLFYPFSFPELHTERYTYNVALSWLVGLNGGVNQFELGGIANINRFAMRGTQVAGIVNISPGKVTGVQAAGIANLALSGNAKVQIAGITNIILLGNAKAQITGITNAAKISDVQIAGCANGVDTAKVQVTGIVNTAREADVQISGIVNAAMQSRVQITGIVNASLGRNITQLAGIVNVADTSGVQLTGILNVARHAGTQIGLVNVADTSSGVSIGLFNFVRRGGLHEFEVSGRFFSASQKATPDISVAYRLGMPRFYTFVEMSYNKDLWMQGLGFGTQINFAGKHGLDIELASQRVTTNARFWEDDGDNQLQQFRLLYHYRVAKYFTLFGGPTLNFYFTDTNKAKTINIPTSYTIFEEQYGNILTKWWIGFSVGVRL